MKTERDFSREMRELIESSIGLGPYVPRTVAHEIVSKLQESDPDLLSGWVSLHLETFVSHTISTRDRNMRASTRRSAKAHRFAEAANSSNYVELANFLNIPYTVEDGTTRRLADLTAADLGFVANRYDRAAKNSAMNAAFMRALAEKIGDGKVSDRFSNKALAEMWRSIGN